ncbi:MAG: hypothetical protein II476_05880 [Bacteroidales bacterium]|nr:hypothetical protein [Bacteroidales bacterium]SKC38036.1 hypothetical protein SAMN06298215_0518 [Bacteroidales bacterium WCE2008]
MKKRFLVNDDAEQLWEEFEKTESIEIKGGDSKPGSIVHDQSNCTITLWKKNF